MDPLRSTRACGAVFQSVSCVVRTTQRKVSSALCGPRHRSTGIRCRPVLGLEAPTHKFQHGKPGHGKTRPSSRQPLQCTHCSSFQPSRWPRIVPAGKPMHIFNQSSPNINDQLIRAGSQATRTRNSPCNPRMCVGRAQGHRCQRLTCDLCESLGSEGSVHNRYVACAVSRALAGVAVLVMSPRCCPCHMRCGGAGAVPPSAQRRPALLVRYHYPLSPRPGRPSHRSWWPPPDMPVA